MTPPDALRRIWLARTLAAAGPALRALAGDPAMVVPGTTPPTPAELDAAAATIEQAATCLRRAAGSAGA